MIDIGWVPLIIVGFIAFMWFVIILSILQASMDKLVDWLKKEDDNEQA